MTHRLWHTGTTLLGISLLYGCGFQAFDLEGSGPGEPDDAVAVAQAEASDASLEVPAAKPEAEPPAADELWQNALDSGMSAARLA